MNIKHNAIRRVSLALTAAVVGVLGFVPVLVGVASAASQVQTRSIEMSDSTPSQTGVSYKVSFTTASANTDSMVIDFCSNSSIIGGACTAPAGIDAQGSIAFTAGTGTTGWNVDTAVGFVTANSANKNTVAIKDTSGTGANKITSGGTSIDFTLTSITNPSATGSFWARVYTYTDDSYGSTGTQYADPQNIGTNLDYGGFALSTVSLINISATVMETLTFCVNKGVISPSCTGLSTPVALTLGHGTPQVLDSSQVDTDDAYFQVSTNALSGANIRMKSHNTCTGLSRNGGADSCPIPGMGALAAIPASTADFGLNVLTVAGGTGAVAPDAAYDGTANSTHYAMGAGVTSTYGDTIATTGGTASASTSGHMTFAAQSSVTTPAGVYTAAESLIATGTF